MLDIDPRRRGPPIRQEPQVGYEDPDFIDMQCAARPICLGPGKAWGMEGEDG